MKSIAAIDFSINSACVALASSEGYHWHHFGREKTKYFDLGQEGFTQHLFPKRTKGDDYCRTERGKLDDALIVCSSIADVLRQSSVEAVAFEAHSFNSKGNSLLELVSYQFLLRTMVREVLQGKTDSMFFYSPITVKAFAGGAKFKKKEMLERFLLTDDEVLASNPVLLKIQGSMQEVLKGEDVAKPVDDLVDSYWILKKLQQDV